MMESLKDKIVIVTGGTAGIGKAIAMAFAANGAKVTIYGTNAARGEQVVSEMETKGQFIQVDVSDTEAVKGAVDAVVNTHGGVDILVNNAGITRDGLLLKMTEDDWDRVLDVNVKSCFNTTKAITRSMIKRRKGKIINISSVVGIIGNAGQGNYAASKAAIIGFTKAVAKELASRNICVNCVAPGFVDTAMTEDLSDEQKKSLLEVIPLNRMGKPEEIANVVLFLASDAADYITGQVLTVDGGMVM